MAFAKLDNNPVEANEIILRNAVIQEVSDMDILESDEHFMSLMQHMADLLVVKKSTSRAL